MTPKPIKLYNTKSRTVENFEPITPGKVGMYSCGPTVYHYAHIGNLRAYIIADIIRKTFLSAGYEIKNVINITDVGHLVGDSDDGQDKLEKGAAREGKNVWEIAKMYSDAYFKDLQNLNITVEDYIFPRATDNIREQIGLISALEISGHTYTISDGIYFDTSTFPHYADFAHLDIEGLQSGARVEENKEKRNITDFALWKFSPKNEKRQMEWESPWGVGFPGWHIECSAMSMKYLGEHFDIHTGGIDHIPVHHTNEIAQSECVTGETYVNYWMHINFLNDRQGKMSKSNDDFLTLDKLSEKGYIPLIYRYYILTAHYRSEIEFSFESLDGATQAYHKLLTWCASHKTDKGVINEAYSKKFEDVIFNDFNTPQAIALMWIMLKDENISNDDKYTTLLSFDSILSLSLADAEKEEVKIPEEVKILMNARASARLAKDFTESDRLRDEIEKLGYIIKDTSLGQEINNL